MPELVGGDIIYRMTGDMTGLQKSMGAVKTQAGSLGQSFMQHSTAIGVGMTAAGAAISGTLGMAVNKWASYGDQIGKMAKRTGLGSDELSKLAFAAGQTGTSVESVEVGIRRMAKGLTDANTKGTGPAKDAMDALGLSLDTFEGKNPSEAFAIFAEAIRQVPDPLQKSAFAQDIFGKSGTALLPLIAEGSAGLKAYGEEATKLGIVMDDKATAKAELFVDTMDELKRTFQGVMIVIGPMIADNMIPLAENIKSLVISVSEWAKENQPLVGGLIKAAAALGGFLTVLGPIVIAMPGLVATVGVLKGAAGFIGLSTATAAAGSSFFAILIPAALVVGSLAAIAWGIYEVMTAWEEHKAAQEVLKNTNEQVSKTQQRTIELLKEEGVAIDEKAFAQLSLSEREEFLQKEQQKLLDTMEDSTAVQEDNIAVTDEQRFAYENYSHSVFGLTDATWAQYEAQRALNQAIADMPLQGDQAFGAGSAAASGVNAGEGGGFGNEGVGNFINIDIGQLGLDSGDPEEIAALLGELLNEQLMSQGV
jgi:hypothetical protein